MTYVGHTLLALGMAAALCASGPALSQPAPVPPPPTAAFQSAFDDWVQKYKPQTAIAMVQIAGRPVFSRGFNANPDAPTLIGSMSKAVTGACIATLIGEGKLSFTTPMKDAMPGYFRNFGPPADTRLMDVTVEQLLAHRSGLPGNSDGDRSTASFANAPRPASAAMHRPGRFCRNTSGASWRAILDRRFPTATRTTSRLPR